MTSKSEKPKSAWIQFFTDVSTSPTFVDFCADNRLNEKGRFGYRAKIISQFWDKSRKVSKKSAKDMSREDFEKALQSVQ
tara:strand:- start:4050 stop:4286 length:237 start_codon:yes stop_codon:yes gene_type:complete